MKNRFIPVLLFAASTSMFAEDKYINPTDTTKVVDIEEVVVIASPKETGKLRELPSSVSLISQKQMQAHHVTSLKDASVLSPNFYMPDYGSKLTSAIYIRGIGSRMNTPAIGLYVDNIPYLDKSAFDFNFYDIERIDILRGPQGTLYGRNTMGGLVKVNTRSPFTYNGTDVKLGYATKNNSRTASLSHYHRISDRFAFSLGGYYEGSNGFFRNSYTGKKIDKLEAGGGRARAIWLPKDNMKLDFSISYDYSDEGGYPYFYTGPVKGYEQANEQYKDYVGKISYNQDCTYRRGLFNTGLNFEIQSDKFIFNAVTGYQNLSDRMFMDQDFLPMNIYTLEQKQKLNSLTEEITFKNKNNSRWQWVNGASAFYQSLKTSSPVGFMEEGVSSLIEDNMNRVFSMIKASNPRAPKMTMDVLNNTLMMNNDFSTPSLSTALFHQSTFNDILVEGLSFTAGLRLEYEKLWMRYDASSSIDFDFNVEVSPTMKFPMKNLNAAPRIAGKTGTDYWQLLPKFALKYDLSKSSNIYASVTKGYRSGGYNIQMFSDLIQKEMQTAMTGAIVNGVPNIQGLPANMVPVVQNMINTNVPAAKEIDVKGTTLYKPEYSWNFEVGSHFDLFNGKVKADVAAFLMNTHDQQIVKFVESGLGRIMVNAGKSRSIGAEAAFIAAITKSLNFNVNYGYTYSTFRKYDGGVNRAGVEIDYTGNYVPFVPKHTLAIGGDYTFFLNDNALKDITIGANYTGAGNIYWSESNDQSQDFVGSLNGYLSLGFKNLKVDFWGRNLTDKKYTTFYFESMNRGFEQYNKPIQFGVDLKYHF